jgi:hypothetical protein
MTTDLAQRIRARRKLERLIRIQSSLRDGVLVDSLPCYDAPVGSALSSPLPESDSTGAVLSTQFKSNVFVIFIALASCALGVGFGVLVSVGRMMLQATN